MNSKERRQQRSIKKGAHFPGTGVKGIRFEKTQKRTDMGTAALHTIDRRYITSALPMPYLPGITRFSRSSSLYSFVVANKEGPWSLAIDLP